MIASSQMLTRLQSAAQSVGNATLGFEPKEIGTHSLRSGAAMEMYLTGVPLYTIMLIGRWSSDAFLHYIRKQVEQFSLHVAKQMLTFRSFRKISDIAPRVVSMRTLGSGTTVTMPRQDEILEATGHGGSSYLPFPVSPNRSTMRSN